MDILFREHSQNIYIYPSLEVENDPFTHEVDVTELNPLPIKAIVTDISPASSQWKMPGIISEKTKQIFIKSKYLSLLKMSSKIKIDDDYYYGWKTNGRLNYVIEDKYIRCYVYVKKES